MPGANFFGVACTVLAGPDACADAQHGMTLAQPSPAQIAEAQDLQALLQAYLHQHTAVDGGLAQRMLEMANQRLQLAQLHA